MLVYILMLLSCVEAQSLDGESFTRSCRWHQNGLYSMQATCEAAGIEQIGRPVFSDVADGRKITKSRCDATPVTK